MLEKSPDCLEFHLISSSAKVQFPIISFVHHGNSLGWQKFLELSGMFGNSVVSHATRTEAVQCVQWSVCPPVSQMSIVLSGMSGRSNPDHKGEELKLLRLVQEVFASSGFP